MFWLTRESIIEIPANKWKILSGTGKHKDIKGTGTCVGTRDDDGSSDWACTGTNSTGIAKQAEGRGRPIHCGSNVWGS